MQNPIWFGIFDFQRGSIEEKPTLMLGTNHVRACMHGRRYSQGQQGRPPYQEADSGSTLAPAIQYELAHMVDALRQAVTTLSFLRM